MKITGEKLQALLGRQWESVTLVAADGTERRGISAKIASAEIAGGAFTGYGRSGIVERVVANNAPRRGPFATRRDITAVMADFPSLPHATPQAPGAHSFVPEPRFAHTGHAGKISTVHFDMRQKRSAQ